ncbi:acyltransferase [uncultured Xylophilus sp.]|uniref:acyltransferase family protein n=1 Tax=uncultured Xylophilus sp. TaxID=296832 RepID=UPI0025EC1E6A|nr:acyltransferase [uncultured Xylophilus sp.]
MTRPFIALSATSPAPPAAASFATPLAGLQHLRGIAALMVVAYHLQLPLERMGYGGPWPTWGAAGVDIFFVLSGFLMWHTTADRTPGPWAFWRRRIVRIVPLYWLLTSVVVAVMLVAPGLLQSVRFDPLNVLGSYLFFFAPAASGRMEPALVVGWTLNYEMLFYLLFGAVLWLPAAVRFAATALAIAALVALGRTEAMAGPLGQMYSASILLEFVFGMAVAVWWRRTVATPVAPRGALAVLIAGAVLLATLDGLLPGLPRAVALGLPATLVVVGMLQWERAGGLPAWRRLHAIGDQSYSLYLSHPIVLSAFAQLWRVLGLHGLPGGIVLFALLAVPVCVLAAAVLYRWVERPLLRLGGAHRAATLSAADRAGRSAGRSHG